MSGIANPKTTGNHPVDFGVSDLLDHKQRAMATKPAETAGADGAHVKRSSSSIEPIPNDGEVHYDAEILHGQGARRAEARVNRPDGEVNSAVQTPEDRQKTDRQSHSFTMSWKSAREKIHNILI
jgi:hypothetical protein